jgi:hypothetical protein
LDKKWRVYTEFNFAKDPGLRRHQPLIVPPISAKDFNVACLQGTWRSIHHAISDATELHIIGYSLPKEDQFARLVLRRALRSNFLKVDRKQKPPLAIRVVNPDDTAAVTFTRLAGFKKGGLDFFQTRFEDYVHWLDGPG